MIESIHNLDITESWPGMFAVSVQMKVRANSVAAVAGEVQTALLSSAEETK
jgi:hypothetical protein